MPEAASSPTSRLIRAEGVTLRAETEALAALDRAIREGVSAFPRRGLEIGGALLGAVEGEIRIDEVRPLPLQLRSSPAFQPSAADLRMLKNSGRGEPFVIGHFRSQTFGETAPAEIDDTIADLLDSPEPLLLLISASAAGVGPARLYRRRNRDWLPLLQFPLIESAPPASAITSPVSRPSWVAPPPNLRKWRWRISGGIAVCLLCGVLLGRMIWHPRAAAVVPPASTTSRDIGLTVRPSGPGIEVNWNPASAAIAQGFSGMLTVQDGDRRLQIPLDRQQLRRGSTVYVPENSWVELRLEIYRDGNHYIGEALALPTGVSAVKGEPKQAASKTPVQNQPKRQPVVKAAVRETPKTRRAPVKRRPSGPYLDFF